MTVPVHVISGFLGAGKTTAIRAWMADNAGRERCAVIVNDFGEAGIDAASLRDTTGGAARVINIPGGCVCCTAPEGLAQTLDTLVREMSPDRIFIEPSGLARPQDIVDMVVRGSVRDRIVHMPTIVMVDPRRLHDPPPLLDQQLEAADVVVANRCDLAGPADMQAFRARVASMWPAPMCVVETTFGELPRDALDWPEKDESGPDLPDFVTGDPDDEEAPPPHAAHDDHAHADHAHEGSGARDTLADPIRASTDGYFARSWLFASEARFSWDALRGLLAGTAGIERFKGIFSGDIGWFRVEVANGAIHLSTTGHRRDSRADLITRDVSLLDRFGAALEACGAPELTAGASGPTLVLVGLDGFELAITREALAALRGQVPDVSERVPGRSGEGIFLRDLFPLTTTAPGARYVITASDGLQTPPVPLAGAGDAILVHSLGGEDLPAAQGGPLRLLVPPATADGTKSNCANVKGVARIRILPAE